MRSKVNHYRRRNNIWVKGKFIEFFFFLITYARFSGGQDFIYKAHPQVCNYQNGFISQKLHYTLVNYDFNYCFNEFDIDALCSLWTLSRKKHYVLQIWVSNMQILCSL